MVYLIGAAAGDSSKHLWKPVQVAMECTLFYNSTIPLRKKGGPSVTGQGDSVNNRREKGADSGLSTGKSRSLQIKKSTPLHVKEWISLFTSWFN
ncbi:hypothetical protein GCM10007103_29030 [Salinimicrobium marinum]|uniref:Uncharacterized protein n=1 Tax=Salinimicrobium marinum TaxID=680283 RepID=A0A918W1V2_9FLAO|nr:hypothetical protein [Salinimicrobium marinum]GHA46143.1 hypothetical protein GCM10007103_29030 [Salinimicrobium marinum]